MPERFIPIEGQRHERTLKAFLILKELQRKAMDSNEIARKLGCSPRTSLRFLNTLHHAGFIVMKAGKRYYVKNGKESDNIQLPA